jgi:NAD(P)-dependent dehydrogenase (short-subunit alcohol dehydrogenase family)
VSGKRRMCIVAGASRGIGRACADHLVQQGWRVCGLSRKRPDSWPDDHPYVELDLIDALDSPAMVRDALVQVDALPGIDDHYGCEVEFGVVHSVADIYDTIPGAGAPWPRWRTSLDLCLGTAVTLTQATFDEARATSGNYVFISSTGATRPYPGIADYCAAKAALESYMRSLAAELAPARARANCIAAAVVDTDLFRKGPYTEEEAARWHALGRIGTPDQIAAMVGHLIGNDGRWITGQNFCLDGGMLL